MIRNPKRADRAGQRPGDLGSERLAEATTDQIGEAVDFNRVDLEARGAVDRHAGDVLAMPPPGSALDDVPEAR